MNEYLLSVFLGIVEGLTEFLPVSSTAHLRICEKLLGLDLGDGYWKMYSIVIQLGAILCLPIYFRSRIAKFISTFPDGERGDRTAANHPLTLVMIAFFVHGNSRISLDEDHRQTSGKPDDYGLGALDWRHRDVDCGFTVWIYPDDWPSPDGASGRDVRAASGVDRVVPEFVGGVSGHVAFSMSTIAAGQLAGMSRTAALEFSFFLSIPTMVAATGYDLLRTLHPKHGAPLGTMPANSQQWIVLIIGFVVSFVVALGVVAWFMNWVRQRGFTPFAIYRIVVGIAVLVWVYKDKRPG